jgi:E3 ubiquitin-protein ligase TRIP12
VACVQDEQRTERGDGTAAGDAVPARAAAVAAAAAAAAAEEGGEGRAGRDGAPGEYMRGSMSALQHLLSKLGGSIDEASLMSLMAGGGGGVGGSFKARYKAIVDRLVSPDSDAQLLCALEELSEALAMSQEEQLVGFPVDTVAPVLVRTLQSYDEQPNIMLYAARVVTWLADILPASCAVLVRHDAVAALCGQLLQIGFMDVAEQCLTALEKLAAHVPESCLRQARCPLAHRCCLS